MSQLLDLSITLTSPPQSSPLEVLATISLNCDVLGMNHTGDHLFNPLTEQEREELRWYLDEYPLWPYYEFAERAKQIEALLPKLGKRLYDSVFGRRQADRIVQKWL